MDRTLSLGTSNVQHIVEVAYRDSESLFVVDKDNKRIAFSNESVMHQLFNKKQNSRIFVKLFPEGTTSCTLKELLEEVSKRCLKIKFAFSGGIMVKSDLVKQMKIKEAERRSH